MPVLKNTINGEEPWEYLDLLNECIKIILTVGWGALLGHFKVFDANTFVPHAVKFVFYVALPFLVLRGLGIVIDFYDDSFSWRFIALFLALRAIALLLAFAWIWFKGGKHEGIGHVAVMWLALSWISTVILGIPISTAVFGNKEFGTLYGLLAGISSFIFQLPFQLLFLECHALGERGKQDAQQKAFEDAGVSNSAGDCETPSPIFEVVHDSGAKDERLEEAQPETKDHSSRHRLLEWMQYAGEGSVWKNLRRKLLLNPVLWGIAGGFILSISTLGPKYLNPKPSSLDYIPGLGWIFTMLSWFAECVSPVSLFTMGVWMESQGVQLFQLRWQTAFLFMFSKLVIVPLIMLGLALAADLDDVPGRAAVLIAALPISLASFSLASNYDIGQAVLSENVAMGTLLLLPTILIWNLVLDGLDIFPVPDELK
jgi:predicted permease